MSEEMESREVFVDSSFRSLQNLLIQRQIDNITAAYNELKSSEQISFNFEFNFDIVSIYQDIQSTLNVLNLYPSFSQDLITNIFDIKDYEITRLNLEVNNYFCEILKNTQISKSDANCNDVLNYHLRPGMIKGVEIIEKLIQKYQVKLNLRAICWLLQKNLKDQKCLFEDDQLFYSHLKLDHVGENGTTIAKLESQKAELNQKGKDYVINRFCKNLAEYLFQHFKIGELEKSPIQTIIDKLHSIIQDIPNISNTRVIVADETKDNYLLTIKFNGYKFFLEIDKSNYEVFTLRAVDTITNNSTKLNIDLDELARVIMELSSD